MDRLGIVPQILQRKPLRIAALERTLSPRIPIRMQRHPHNPQLLTPRPELRRRLNLQNKRASMRRWASANQLGPDTRYKAAPKTASNARFKRTSNFS